MLLGRSARTAPLDCSAIRPPDGGNKICLPGASRYAKKCVVDLDDTEEASLANSSSAHKSLYEVAIKDVAVPATTNINTASGKDASEYLSSMGKQGTLLPGINLRRELNTAAAEVESVESSGAKFSLNCQDLLEGAALAPQPVVTPTPPRPETKPLISSLRPHHNGSKWKKTAKTNRRVRGLWNENCASLFSHLHDDMIVSIMSYLTLADLIRTSMVCHRWKYVSSLAMSRNEADATEFVEQAFNHFAKVSPDTASEDASQALNACLQRHPPRILSIRSIEHRLVADTFLPRLKGLQELTLTGFVDLTDTHVHVMLLSHAVVDVQARFREGNLLRRLCLEQCPLLTNASVRSIASTCPNLQELSLRGCRKIDSIVPLKDCWKTEMRITERIPTVQSMVSLQSFFAPPPSSTARATSRPSTPTTGLSSLFAPPTGLSPTRPSRTGSFSKASASAGKLARIDLSHTMVTPSALLAALRFCSDEGRIVQLESLRMRGSGESWRDNDLKQLPSCLQPSVLRVLDIGYADSFTGSSSLTSGLDSLFACESSLQLERLSLAGHCAIPAKSIGKVVSASPNLESLNLEGCKRVGSSDEETLALAFSLSGRKNPGLRRLSLARCFSNERQAKSLSAEQFCAEEARGRSLLEALCQSPLTYSTLKELDLGGCWFVSSEDEVNIREAFPRLVSLRVDNTRCAS